MFFGRLESDFKITEITEMHEELRRVPTYQFKMKTLIAHCKIELTILSTENPILLDFVNCFNHFISDC